jgi:hypothetical protein
VTILSIGAALRLYNIGAPSIVEDEAYHAVTAAAWVENGAPFAPSGQLYARGLPMTYLEMLSLRYLPLKFETALRLPVALLGILNTFLFFVLGKRYGGNGLGLVAALLFAVSPWGVWFGKNLRMYELLLTCSLLCLQQYERLVENPSWPRAFLLSAVLSLGVATHDLGILLMLLPLVGIFVHFQRRLVVCGLAVGAAIQLLFWRSYPVFLAWLFPSDVEVDKLDGISWMFVGISFEAQRFAWLHARTFWIVSSFVLLVTFALSLPGQRIRRNYEPALWTAGILISGIAGMLLVSFFLLCGYLAVMGRVSDDSQTFHAHRIQIFRWFAAIVFLWCAIVVLASLDQSAIGIKATLRNFISTLRFPDISHGVVRPLLRETQVAPLFLIGMGIATLICLRGIFLTPVIIKDDSFIARNLFVLSAIFFIGSFAGNYRSDRYLYFLLPSALLSLLQVIRAYLLSNQRWIVRSFAAMALGVVVAFELSVATCQVLPVDESRADSLFARLHYLGMPSNSRHQIDYRQAAEFLRSVMRENDVLIVDAAHQFQTYVTRIDGHLVPNLNEYTTGTHHYLTGAPYLRSWLDLQNFVRSIDPKATTRVWIGLTGYTSAWTEILEPRLVQHQRYRKGLLALYVLTPKELLTALNECGPA